MMRLRELIKEELKVFNTSESKESWVKIRMHLKGDVGKDRKLFNISCRGAWFDKRQAITFEPNGFIGFSGWASSKYTQPFINAFVKRCNELVGSKLIPLVRYVSTFRENSIIDDILGIVDIKFQEAFSNV